MRTKLREMREQLTLYFFLFIYFGFRFFDEDVCAFQEFQQCISKWKAFFSDLQADLHLSLKSKEDKKPSWTVIILSQSSHVYMKLKVKTSVINRIIVPLSVAAPPPCSAWHSLDYRKPVFTCGKKFKFEFHYFPLFSASSHIQPLTEINFYICSDRESKSGTH